MTKAERETIEELVKGLDHVTASDPKQLDDPAYVAGYNHCRAHAQVVLLDLLNGKTLAYWRREHKRQRAAEESRRRAQIVTNVLAGRGG